MEQVFPGDFPGLAGMLTVMALVYVLGAVCSYGYSRIMVQIAQTTMANIRADLFSRMQGPCLAIEAPSFLLGLIDFPIDAAALHQFLMGPLGDDAPAVHHQNQVRLPEKQRLCIARAILKKPKVLILDDSTSAVDTCPRGGFPGWCR